MVADIQVRETEKNKYVAIQISLWELDKLIEELSAFSGESGFLNTLQRLRERNVLETVVEEVHDL